jgi:cyanophycin synthetase
MKIIQCQQLTGVNHWFHDGTFAAVVADVPEGPIPPHLLQPLVERLEELPIPAYQAGAGERMRRAAPPDAGWGRGLIELAAELQFLSGETIGARAERRTSLPGVVQVALQCQEFALADACLAAALQTCVRLQRGEPLELGKIYDDLTARAYDVCLGGSTGPLVAAARQRGIPAYRLDAESLVQLGEGVHQKRICTAMTSRTSHIAVQVSSDKHLVSQLWARIGIPVAPGRLAQDEEIGVRAAQEVGWPVVVKPADADYGRGVCLPLRTVEQVRAAYPKARACSSSGRVIVQRYLRGASHRLLVVDGRLASALRRDPISVVGDGRHSVRELVDQANRDARWGPDRRTDLGEGEEALLVEAGFTPEMVPAPGVRVPLSHNVLEIYSDVTERVHPDTRDLALDAARVIGLDVAGLDAIAVDIGCPLVEQGGGFLEINAQPAIAIHRAPHCDRPRDVGDAVVSALFPPPFRGRASLVIVLGGPQADEVVACAAELLRRGGRQVAASTPKHSRWQHRPLAPASSSLADRLLALMLHPRTEAAVVSATWAEVLETGLGTDRCHVLVFAEGPHGAKDGDSEEMRELLRQLRQAARCCAVNLDDPRGAECAATATPTTVLVSSNPTDPRLFQHLATGRLAAFPQEGEVVMRAGEVELARFAAPAGSPADTISIPAAQILAAAAVFAMDLDVGEVRQRETRLPL